VRQVLQKRSRRVEGFFYLGSYSNDGNWAGETALLRRSALAGPVVNNASALFKSLEITPHLFFMRCVTGTQAAARKPPTSVFLCSRSASMSK